MRDLYLMSFTEKGEATAYRIAESLRGDPEWRAHIERVRSLRDSVAQVFHRGNILVFIGAMGIAVRAVAPHVRNKNVDPAVIVVDEQGRHVIPMLSGHIGGANRIACRIASFLGAEPVVTTATDLRGVFAVDIFATKYGYTILDPEMIKTVSARLLDGQTVGLSTSLDVEGPLPENVSFQDRGDVGIYIGLRSDEYPFEKTLRLIQKCFYVGVGTRKGISPPLLHDFFVETLDSHDIPVAAIAGLSSIDLKRNEIAIVELAQRYQLPFSTYPAEELRERRRPFTESDFVRKTTRTGNVCEAAAWLSSNRGTLVLRKTVRPGMTLAIAREDRTIRFDRNTFENGRADA